jgi:glycosyltransferase involved in cell wall biosynthesis
LDLDLRYKNLKTIDWKSLAKEQSCNVTDESILIGFFGSESHYDDLEILEEPIKRILDEYKNVIFCVMGGYVLPLSVICNKWKLPFNKFLFLPIKQIHDYPSYVNCFDIGLAPLQKTVFNRGKSNLKLIEYGALGIPYVASKVANFQRFQTESKAIGGFTCDSTEEWYRSIKFLIENPEKRKSFGQELKDYVYKEYDVKNSLGLLMNVFDTIQYNKTTKRFKKPNFYEMSDSINNIPPVKEVYTHKDKCPCGSDDLYVNCKNNCYPAWGLVVE